MTAWRSRDVQNHCEKAGQRLAQHRNFAQESGMAHSTSRQRRYPGSKWRETLPAQRIGLG